MIGSMRYTKGLGNDAIYARLTSGVTFYNFTTLVFDEEETDNCRVYLTEVADTSPDLSWYTGQVAQPSGGPYNVDIVLASTGEVIGNDFIPALVELTPTSGKTILQIINDVQRRLRLPESADLTAPHAKILLSMANEVQRNMVAEYGVWDELKIYPSINTVQGCSVYELDYEIDTIRSIKIGINPPLERVGDTLFNDYKRNYTEQGIPLAYRRRSKLSGVITLEVCPFPDKVYRMDCEVVIRPPLLVNADDIPLLDADTLFLGMKYLAKKDQGQDASSDLGEFQSKLSFMSGSQNNSNSGDVDFL